MKIFSYVMKIFMHTWMLMEFSFLQCLYILLFHLHFGGWGKSISSGCSKGKEIFTSAFQWSPTWLQLSDRKQFGNLNGTSVDIRCSFFTFQNSDCHWILVLREYSALNFMMPQVGLVRLVGVSWFCIVGGDSRFLHVVDKPAVSQLPGFLPVQFLPVVILRT